MNTSKDSSVLNNDSFPLSELNYNVNQLLTCQPLTSQQLSKPIQEQNEIIASQKVDDSQNNSSEEENFLPNRPKKRRRGGGPKRDPVWDYVNIGDHLGDGHYGASCRYCQVVWNREKPQILKHHLARECEEVPYDIKEIWRDNLAMEEKTIR
ncbi:12633_t:CDS:1, partial [Ambispora leptoticha]